MPEDGGGAPGVEPPAPEPEAWAGPSQEQWEQTQQALGQLGPVSEYVQQQMAERQRYAEWQAQQGQQQARYDIDLFGEDPGSQIAAIVQHQLQQAMAPFADFMQGSQLSEAEERALDILEDDIAQNGEFLVGDGAMEAARALANAYMPELVQQYGYGPQAAEAALVRAAATIRQYEQAVSKAAIDRHLNQLRTLDGAPGEPGTTYGVGAQELITGDYRAGGRVTDRFFGGVPGA